MNRSASIPIDLRNRIPADLPPPLYGPHVKPTPPKTPSGATRGGYPGHPKRDSCCRTRTAAAAPPVRRGFGPRLTAVGRTAASSFKPNIHH